MRISDWSSDVCSSDLIGAGQYQVRVSFLQHRRVDHDWSRTKIDRKLYVGLRKTTNAVADHGDQQKSKGTRRNQNGEQAKEPEAPFRCIAVADTLLQDRKSTRLNSSH